MVLPSVEKKSWKTKLSYEGSPWGLVAGTPRGRCCPHQGPAAETESFPESGWGLKVELTMDERGCDFPRWEYLGNPF